MTRTRTSILLGIIAIFLFFPACSKPAQYTKTAIFMDTFVRIEINDNLSAEKKKNAFDKTIVRMKELEKRFDFFSGDSELTKLNDLIAQRDKSEDKVELLQLSPELAEVLTRAEGFRELTGGAFDVRMGKKDKINLGGIAKGFIVDEGVKVLKNSNIKNALINAGGDMYCMGNGLGEGWRIGIRDPGNSQRVMARFRVRDKGVATSGNYERPSHIIDPRTGRPIEEILRSVTVVAADSMTADALATALYVLGPADGLVVIKRIDGAECAIVEGGKVHISEGFPQIALTKPER
jgi:thiamine biosynthesis lipoprotein